MAQKKSTESSFSLSKRPDPNETEDDILRFQEEFLKHGSRSSKIVTTGNKTGICDLVKNQETPEVMPTSTPLQMAPILGANSVLFSIKEKEVDYNQPITFKTPRTNIGSKARAKYLKPKDAAAKLPHKHPAYAGVRSKIKIEPMEVDPKQIQSKNWSSTSAFAAMSEEEILQEKEKLLKTLKPEILKFLKNRHKKEDTSQDPACNFSNTDIKPISSDVKDLAAANVDELPKEPDLPLNPEDVKKFPGMQNVEKHKLAWAGTIQQPVHNYVGQNARFEFSGHLILEESNEDNTVDKGLHHHGEEMERAGYTLNELLILSRSSNMQQRSIALETIGNIFVMAHKGWIEP